MTYSDNLDKEMLSRTPGFTLSVMEVTTGLDGLSLLTLLV